MHIQIGGRARECKDDAKKKRAQLRQQPSANSTREAVLWCTRFDTCLANTDPGDQPCGPQHSPDAVAVAAASLRASHPVAARMVQKNRRAREVDERPRMQVAVRQTG